MSKHLYETYTELGNPKIGDREAKELLGKLYDIAYDNAFRDAYKNVTSIMETRKRKNELAEKLYDSMSYADIEKLIKKDLPLRVRLFNKVSVIGKSLIREDTILYTYCFNGNYARRFQYVPALYDLEKLTR